MTEGIILLDKPAGQTSFQSLGFLKRALATGRVGHTGTLDRFAEGLLVVLAGRLTRLCAVASGMDKEYVSVFTFGKETETLDPEGAVIAEGPLPSLKDIEQALPSFRGEISQVPPVYSAVHVGGQRASQAARRGEEVVLAPRTVTVHEMLIIDYAPPELSVRISCSKGTYVRSLARDLGRRLQTRAFVSRLRRTRVGPFRVEQAHSPDSLRVERDLLPPGRMFDASTGLGRVSVRPERAEAVSRGARLDADLFLGPLPVGLLGAFCGEDLVAVIENSSGAPRYLATFPRERAGEHVR